MLCDLHQHLVYGVDDGAADETVSLGMLQACRRQHISTVICTSHMMPGYRDFPAQAYQEAFYRLRELAAPDVQLCTGSEIMYTAQTPEYIRKGWAMTLAGSASVLVEFLPEVSYDQIERAVRDLNNIGCLPVLAHIERYMCLRDRRRLDRLRDEDCALQMNARTVLRSGGLFGDHWAREAISGGYIDVVASDAHDTLERPQCLGEAYEFLRKKWGEDLAQALCRDNPNELVTNGRVAR